MLKSNYGFFIIASIILCGASNLMASKDNYWSDSVMQNFVQLHEKNTNKMCKDILQQDKQQLEQTINNTNESLMKHKEILENSKNECNFNETDPYYINLMGFNVVVAAHAQDRSERMLKVAEKKLNELKVQKKQ